jgi:hypothetical protein
MLVIIQLKYDHQYLSSLNLSALRHQRIKPVAGGTGPVCENGTSTSGGMKPCDVNSIFAGRATWREKWHMLAGGAVAGTLQWWRKRVVPVRCVAGICSTL